VHNKTISFNSGVLAYKVNSLMMMVATTKFVGIGNDCVRTLESLSVRCILLEIFRKIIMNISHVKISQSNNLLTENKL